MNGMEVTIVHDMELCSNKCKWLIPDGLPPYCYLFGALDARDDGILRAHECVRRAMDIQETPV